MRILKKIGKIALEIALFPFRCIYYILEAISKGCWCILEAIGDFLGSLAD